MSYADIVEHPHYKARGTIVEWPAVPGGRYEGKMVRGAAFPLRFKNNPSQIWRGCPTVGMDNEDVLADAGYTDEEIAALYSSKTIFKENKI
jgi:crotonobetainyl-CoA:carnitine CoA-transferase CaiB-like acyl-CoA transferase